MATVNDALWSRALRALDARGLLPTHRASLTPRELAVHVARRGEDRLTLLVDGWYYPASYGRTDGTLAYDQAANIVAAFESENEAVQMQRVALDVVQPAAAEPPRRPRIVFCDLCGRALV